MGCRWGDICHMGQTHRRIGGLKRLEAALHVRLCKQMETKGNRSGYQSDCQNENVQRVSLLHSVRGTKVKSCLFFHTKRGDTTACSITYIAQSSWGVYRCACRAMLPFLFVRLYSSVLPVNRTCSCQTYCQSVGHVDY
jgi:hypothetical protein